MLQDELAETTTASYGRNSDRQHNAALMVLMLKSGAKQICMFCGEMSVFRNGFYAEIKDERDPEVGKRIKDDVSNALTDFLAKDDSRLRVILEDFKTDYLTDLIIGRELFSEAQRKGKIELYKMHDWVLSKPDIDHYSYTDDLRIVRFEDDKQLHKAFYAINGVSFENLPSNFESFIRVSEAVSI